MAELNQLGELRAAGGVVWRLGPAGGVEVLVVHRPRYDDWSLPKGKAEAGESDEECALREVEEETGLRCRLGEELAGARYVDRHGRPKAVRYWAMEPCDNVAARGAVLAPPAGAKDEVDEIRWLPSASATRSLTYRRDRDVVSDFASSRA